MLLPLRIQKLKRFSPPDQGLCPSTPLGAPPPDPRYRLALPRSPCLRLKPSKHDTLASLLQAGRECLYPDACMYPQTDRQHENNASGPICCTGGSITCYQFYWQVAGRIILLSRHLHLACKTRKLSCYIPNSTYRMADLKSR